MQFYEPHSALGILGLVLLGIFIVAAAAIPAWITHRSSKKIGKQAGAVLHQVQNNHPTNLRDDIDDISRAIWGLSSDISGLHTDVRSLRTELRDERSDRIEADERIKLEIQRHPE